MSRSSGLLSVAKHLEPANSIAVVGPGGLTARRRKLSFYISEIGVSSPGDAEPGGGRIARAFSLVVSLSLLANWRIDEKEAKSLYVIEKSRWGGKQREMEGNRRKEKGRKREGKGKEKEAEISFREADSCRRYVMRR